MKKRLEDSWSSIKPTKYPNGGSFGRRDALPIAAVAALFVVAYVAHDLFGVPLPDGETMAFMAFIWGLYHGRRFVRN